MNKLQTMQEKLYIIVFSLFYIILAALFATGIKLQFNLGAMESVAVGVVFLFALSIFSASVSDRK